MTYRTKNKICFLFMIVLFVFTIFVLTGCEDKNSETDDEEKIVYKELNIIQNGTLEYDLLCAEKSSTDVLQAIKTLANKISDKTKVTVKAYRDNFTSEEGRKEILLGLTNREESIEVYNSLEENSYKIEVKNNCVVIVGSSIGYTMLALYQFEETVLNNSELCGEGFLKVTTNQNINKKYDHELNFNDYMTLGYKPYASIEKFFTAPIEGDIKVAQGACTDGTYIYCILRDSGDSKALIYKYDMDGNFVCKSEEIYLGHGNDMCYVSKHDYLMVAHGVKEANTYSIINKTTLKVEKTFTVEEGGGGSIAYLPSKDMYATSKGGETLSLYDQDFKLIKTVDREIISYTAQGIGSDDNYIYCPMSGDDDNVLVVYDWDGNFITNVIVNTGAESETMFYYNGQYYLYFYVPASGGVVYKMNFSIKYE